MSNRPKHQRAQLDINPAALLTRLPAIGRVMINAEYLGATHERIGQVEKVRIENGWMICEGAEHDSRIELAAIASIIVDRTSVMREKSYPRIELRDTKGETIANVTGFEGLEPFDAVLSAFPQGIGLPVEEHSSGGDARTELNENDPGLTPFRAAERNNSRIEVTLSTLSFQQRWEGNMPGVKSAMGYVNIIQPDFHLHLKGGSVGGWRREDNDARTRFLALANNGSETGLAVTGPTTSFA